MNFFQQQNHHKMYPIPPPPPPLSIPPMHFDRDISPPRKRTRTSPEQLAVLEKSFSINPSPNNRMREQLAHQLGMPERSIQIWFQNRRAKVKNQAKRSVQLHDSALYRQQQYAASAAAAACQTAAFQQQQESIDPNLYYYYYYYYFNQPPTPVSARASSSEEYVNQSSISAPPPPPPPPPPAPSSSFSTPTSAWPSTSMTPPFNTGSMPDLTLSASTSSSSITSDNHHHSHHVHRRHHHRSSSASSSTTDRTRSHSVGPYPYYRKSTPHERHSSLGPPPTASLSNPLSTTTATTTATTTTNSTSANTVQPHSFMFGTSADAKLYNSSTILEEPYHITPSDSARRPAQQQCPLTPHTLQIGTWKRVSDLKCSIDMASRTLIWCLGDEQQSFRIDINLNLIQFIRVHHTLANTYKLEFFLSSPNLVKFFMTVHGAWVQCHDFTQDRQASSENVHILEGFSLLQNEFMDILMQAPDLQSLVIHEEEGDPYNTAATAAATMYHHSNHSGGFFNNSSHSLLMDDTTSVAAASSATVATDDGMATNLLLLQGLHLP